MMMNNHFNQLQASNQRHSKKRSKPDTGNGKGSQNEIDTGFKEVKRPKRRGVWDRRSGRQTVPSYHLPMNSGVSKSNTQRYGSSHDFWNGDLPSKNRYDILRREDEDMYSDPPNSSDEEYKQYVQERNSQYM